VLRALPAIAVLLFAAPATAQEEGVPETAPPAEVPPPPPAAPDAPASDVRYLDAAANRVVWLPTAETNPEGTFFFGIYEVLGLQFGYALTDDIEFALTGVVPIDTFPYAFDLSIKWNVLRHHVFRIALFGSIGVYVDGDREEAIGGRAGAAFQLCFNDDCTSHASLSAGALISNHIDTELPFAVGAGVVVRVHRLLALVVEPLYGRIEKMNAEDAFVLNYIFRIGQLDWSLDVGMTRPFVDELSGGPFVAGFPWLAFNYRLGWEP
jgi:hypothetical protein